MSITPEATKAFQMWLEDPGIDEATKRELRAIADQPKEIEDRFFKDLEFGTGGLRGLIGAGTNRMNLYTVGRATQGLAQHLLQQGEGGRPVVIAYDSRRMSPEFALEAALVLAGNGIAAYVFDALRPTPELSFAVRELKAAAGIVITASHNPPEYNGYKVYGPDGGQLVPDDARKVTEQIARVTSFAQVRKLPRQEAEAKRLLRWIGDEIDRKYIDAVTAISPNAPLIAQMKEPLRIVYTPLHGAGNHAVRRALKQAGFAQVTVVPEQERPDSEFSTVKSPNPEEREAFTLALKWAEQVGADIVIGTDPDCDRMGAVVRDSSGRYQILTGNQAGALMVHYLLGSLQAKGALPDNGVVIKTIVTGEMGAHIARHYGMATINTLTGFKYIGEKITEFEQTGAHRFLFGYEESYGYLAGTHCRDKDAVVASMLICEAAAYYKMQGKTLIDVLEELYRQYGYFREQLESLTLKGKEGLEKINGTMEKWRNAPPAQIGGLRVAAVEDYRLGLYGLPKENVLKYKLEDGSWFCLRPSGTEPKLKVYFGVRGDSMQAADDLLKRLVDEVMAKVKAS
jgi:phosphoglucomutase